jgi:hypothetical protein
MRLGDLLGADVVDEAGQSAGRVHDVRLVQDGPLIGAFGASLRVAGLIVGRRGIGTRLGYERRELQGPLPVKLVTGWSPTTAATSTGERIRSIQPERIRISGSADDLPSPRPST